MIWLNRWAWAGLATLALPILIHLLGRGRARIQPFPSLRFLDHSRLLPTRRTRLHDLILLLVRLGILASAVFALAHPLVLTRTRRDRLAGGLARAIIVDTSIGMRRVTPRGGRAADSAQTIARSLAADAQTSVLLQTANVAGALPGAVAWLGTVGSRGEVVAISNFDAGAIDSSDVAVVPATIGMRLVRIEVQRVSADSNGRLPRPGATSPSNLRVLVGAADQGRADAAVSAAASIVPQVMTDTSRTMVIAYASWPEFETSRRQARALTQPWMVDVVARLRSDSLLVAAARDYVPAASLQRIHDSGIMVAQTADGRPLVTAAVSSVVGRPGLMLFASVDPGSLASAALIAAARATMSPPVLLGKGDAEPIATAQLGAWQRAPVADVPLRLGDDAANGPSDARWFWAVALLLIGVESWVRRSGPEVLPDATEYDRAA